MLTFPALNGLAFFFAEQRSVGPIARSMLWLPVINGSLCAAFMIVFLSLLGEINKTVLAGSLAVAVVGAWILIAFRPKVFAGIPGRRRFRTGSFARWLVCFWLRSHISCCPKSILLRLIRACSLGNRSIAQF